MCKMQTIVITCKLQHLLLKVFFCKTWISLINAIRRGIRQDLEQDY